MWTMCEFQDSNGNGFGDIWWTDKLIYFSSRPIDVRYIGIFLKCRTSGASSDVLKITWSGMQTS